MKEITHKNKLVLVILIIAASVLIRSYNINGALFDINPLRQAVNAAISRNYAEDSQAQFLLPRMDNMGSGAGYFMFELPILQYMGYLMVKAFGVHNWVFRLPSIILFTLSAIFFYKLCMGFLDSRSSIVALIFYCFAPMSIIMGRAFQTESFTLLALFFSLYFFLKWLKEERPLDLWVCAIGFTILILLKITNLYISVLVAALFFIYKKERLIPRFLIPAFLILAINFYWWVSYSSEIRGLFPNEYTISDKNVQVFSIPHILDVMREYTFSPAYWITIFKHCAWIVLSPILVIFLFLGIFVKKEKRVSAILLTWLLAVIVFISVVPSAALQEYYKIHLVPVAAIFSAFSYLWIIAKIKNAGVRSAAIFSFWIIFALSIFLIVYPVIRHKPSFEKNELLGKKVESISKKGDLVVASFGPDAMLLFYCDRKGWSMYLDDPAVNMIDALEKRRKEGAKYFVCGNLDELDRRGQFKDYIFKHYKLVSREDRQYAKPPGPSLDLLIWDILDRLNSPFLNSLRYKMECRSLGHVIFDLTSKH